MRGANSRVTVIPKMRGANCSDTDDDERDIVMQMETENENNHTEITEQSQNFSASHSEHDSSSPSPGRYDTARASLERLSQLQTQMKNLGALRIAAPPVRDKAMTGGDTETKTNLPNDELKYGLGGSVTVSNPNSQPLKTKTNKLYEKSDENSYGPQTKTINMVNQSNSTISSDKLSVGSLNVCGLKRRILYTEFTDLVQSFDIFCLSETKLLDTEVISCPGYTFFSQPRRQKFYRRSGITVFLFWSEAVLITSTPSSHLIPSLHLSFLTHAYYTLPPIRQSLLYMPCQIMCVIMSSMSCI